MTKQAREKLNEWESKLSGRTPIVGVLVKKDDIFYHCQHTKNGWKCGNCSFGLINPLGDHANQNTQCRRCGAELYETVAGKGYDLISYSP